MKPETAFAFRLALAMGRTVEELKTSMSQKEYIGWNQYYNLEPWGGAISDFHNGLTCSVIANVHSGKGSKRFKATDFMVSQKAFEDRGQNLIQQQAMAQQITAMVGK